MENMGWTNFVKAFIGVRHEMTPVLNPNKAIGYTACSCDLIDQEFQISVNKEYNCPTRYSTYLPDSDFFESSSEFDPSYADEWLT